MSEGSQTLIFWGAGATASIGLPQTAQQAEFIRALAPKFENSDGTLRSRLRKALGSFAVEPWISAFADLLAILGDDDDAEVVNRGSPTKVLPNQRDAMARNWHSDDEDELLQRIVELRTLYDWPALVASINVCPTKPDGGPPELQDLFNVLDMNIQTGHGFRVRDDWFLQPQRVLGARGALMLLIQALFYVAWHTTGRHHADLRHHQDFAVSLARRMQRDGLRIAARLGDENLETDPFIRGDVAFVSMNWDPLGLWPQFVANRALNKLPNVPLVGIPAKRLWMFHDLGHFVAGPRVDKGHAGSKVWQPMNESSARQLNDPHHGAGCASAWQSTCSRMAAYGGASARTAESCPPTSGTNGKSTPTRCCHRRPSKRSSGPASSSGAGPKTRGKMPNGTLAAWTLAPASTAELSPMHTTRRWWSRPT